MYDSKIAPDNVDSQERYQIFVEVQLLNERDTAIKAHADVTIALPHGGSIKICGFSILESADRPLGILRPARKGTRHYFDVVLLSGRIRQDVNAAVKAEYARQRGV